MLKLNRKQIEEISEKTKMSYKDTVLQMLEQLETEEAWKKMYTYTKVLLENQGAGDSRTSEETWQYIGLFRMLSKVEPYMIRQIKALLYGYFEKRGMLGEFENEY